MSRNWSHGTRISSETKQQKVARLWLESRCKEDVETGAVDWDTAPSVLANRYCISQQTAKRILKEANNLQQGDLCVNPLDDGYRYRVRIWNEQAHYWDDHATWDLHELREQCEAHNLIQIEARPALATYTGIYRSEQKAISSSEIGRSTCSNS